MCNATQAVPLGIRGISEMGTDWTLRTGQRERRDAAECGLTAVLTPRVRMRESVDDSVRLRMERRDQFGRLGASRVRKSASQSVLRVASRSQESCVHATSSVRTRVRETP